MTAATFRQTVADRLMLKDEPSAFIIIGPADAADLSECA